MLSALVFFLLLHSATSDIDFLSPSSGQEFASNQSIPIKWKKIAGASNYTIKWNSSDGSIQETYKEPSRCKPRVWIGPLKEGDWSVLVEALNQTGDVIDSGWISFKVCETPPCPNVTVTTTGPPVVNPPAPQECMGKLLRYFKATGYKVQGQSPDATFKTANEQACVDACTNNARPDSTSITCKSIDYVGAATDCQIYSSLTFPQGTIGSIADFTTNHYEKICIAANIPQCQGPFFVEPGKALSGMLVTISATSLGACFESCVHISDCNSANYYRSECSRAERMSVTQSRNKISLQVLALDDNCEINMGTRTTNAGAYQPTLGAYYFEDGCSV